jgi:hypothetical protein
VRLQILLHQEPNPLEKHPAGGAILLVREGIYRRVKCLIEITSVFHGVRGGTRGDQAALTSMADARCRWEHHEPACRGQKARRGEHPQPCLGHSDATSPKRVVGIRRLS